MTTLFETDWLSSRPVFYHELTGKASYNINDVIDFANLEFHPEGFNNYLKFGYSILEQTPVKYVKFLPHSSKLIRDKNGNPIVVQDDDLVDDWLGKSSHEDDIYHLLSHMIKTWENSVEGEIIIPTSGGYDSRLLNLFIEDKSRIRAFTYGVSNNQFRSFEVIHAQKLAEKLGIAWECIPLGDFHLYFDVWEHLYGISTHAHGMYHIEFYAKILPKVTGHPPLLSGVIGDAWAGKVDIPDIKTPFDVAFLGYSHGLNADSTMSLLSYDRSLSEHYYYRYKDKLKSPLFRVVESMRFKILLLSYLIKVPQFFGFQSWSPFLISEPALSMLTLSPERRKDRLWQKNFFEKHRLNFEDMPLRRSYQNTLNHQAMRRIWLKPLDSGLLREVVRPAYIDWVNKHIAQQGYWWDAFWGLQNIRKIGGALRLLGIRERRLEAYCAYLTLKPIENLLKKRESFGKRDKF